MFFLKGKTNLLKPFEYSGGNDLLPPTTFPLPLWQPYRIGHNILIYGVGEQCGAVGARTLSLS